MILTQKTRAFCRVFVDMTPYQEFGKIEFSLHLVQSWQEAYSLQ